MTDKEIGSFLKKRRTDLGYTLEKVASQCDVASSTVLRWESGEISKIKRYHIYMLSKVLYIPVWSILGDELDSSTIVSPEVALKREKLKELIDNVSSLQDLCRIEKIIEALTEVE